MRALVLLAVASFLGAPCLASETEAPANPFAGFETHYLSNGLRVWYKHLPEDPQVSLSVIVPYGSDRDPEGKEELAHFTEHMLFADHMGRTEEEIKLEIEDRGGRRNGVTARDHTYYWVTIDKRHGLLALDWIYRIVSPHEMAPELVDKGRQPVAIEKSVRPRELLDYVEAFYLYPGPLRIGSFWKREFGLPSRTDRAYDPYTSLHSITPEDLRWFYDTFYVPSRMTLVVVGDLGREEVLRRAEATFGELDSRPVPDGYPELRNPRRPFRYFDWAVLANVDYNLRFKIYEMSRDDHLRLELLRRILRNRLRQRLRFGERKAVYSVGVSLSMRGPAAYLGIYAKINPGELDYAEAVIEEELELFRTAGHAAEEFESDKNAVLLYLASDNRQAHDLNMWAAREFYDRDLHEDYPDLIGELEEISQAQLAELAGARLVPENRYEWVTRPHPVSQTFLAIGGIVLVVLVLRLTARWLVRPVEMRKIRYVARIRRSWLHRILVTPLWFLAVTVLFRIVFHLVELFSWRFVLGIESWEIQMLFFGISLAAGIVAFILVWGETPVKVLVFDDHVRLKSRHYRSRSIPIPEIASVSLKRFGDLLREGSLWKTRVMGPGPFRSAVHLERDRGVGYFFDVRDKAEIVAVISELKNRG